MEEKATHPIAQAVLKGAQNEGVSFPKSFELQNHRILKGEGVEGFVNGLKVNVGNQRLFARLGLLRDEHKQKGVTGYMSVEGHGIVCNFTAADGVRPEAADVVGRLQKMGIEVSMLTGDNQSSALKVGGKVGLNAQNIHSKLLPEEKLEHIKELAESAPSSCNPLVFRRRLVLMCGDGVNDAPALAAAHVGVAMGQGASLSMETSDVTLMDSNLEKLVYSIHMGRRVTTKIVQNVIFSVVVKLAVLVYSLVDDAHLWVAIAADVGAMLLVTLNAMTLLPSRRSTIRNNSSVLLQKSTDVEKGVEETRSVKPFVWRSTHQESCKCCSK